MSAWSASGIATATRRDDVERGRQRDILLKHDLVGGDTKSRSFGAGKTLGEFVFHPSSPDAAEDDGVLMGYVYDRTTDRSELAILDAQTLEDVASVKLPHRVPAGFHGNWVRRSRCKWRCSLPPTASWAASNRLPDCLPHKGSEALCHHRRSLSAAAGGRQEAELARDAQYVVCGSHLAHPAVAKLVKVAAVDLPAAPGRREAGRLERARDVAPPCQWNAAQGSPGIT